jgi:hypothetical protein
MDDAHFKISFSRLMKNDLFGEIDISGTEKDIISMLGQTALRKDAVASILIGAFCLYASYSQDIEKLLTVVAAASRNASKIKKK